MKPEEGARKQIEIYRGMPGKERLKIAFAQVKASEKSLNPNLNEKEIERRGHHGASGIGAEPLSSVG
jgi:hypothetical protein